MMRTLIWGVILFSATAWVVLSVIDRYPSDRSQAIIGAFVFGCVLVPGWGSYIYNVRHGWPRSKGDGVFYDPGED